MTRSPRMPGMLERTIILDGFSKTFAMTGWRLGYAAVAARAGRAAQQADDQSQLVHAACDPAAGVEALTGPRDDVRAMVEEFRASPRAGRRRPERHPRHLAASSRRARSTSSRTSPATGMTAREFAGLAARRGRRRRCLAGTSFGEYGEGYCVSPTPTRPRTSRPRSARCASCSSGFPSDGSRGSWSPPDPRAGARPAARGRRRLGVAARPAARRSPSCTRRSRAPTPS